MPADKFEISSEEYQQKRYEICKDMLSSILTIEYLEKGHDSKRRVNLIFNCMTMANNLMEELGYYSRGPKTDEGTSVRRLKDIFENKE